jgi:hypothetical protein
MFKLATVIVLRRRWHRLEESQSPKYNHGRQLEHPWTQPQQGQYPSPCYVTPDGLEKSLYTIQLYLNGDGEQDMEELQPHILGPNLNRVSIPVLSKPKHQIRLLRLVNMRLQLFVMRAGIISDLIGMRVMLRLTG